MKFQLILTILSGAFILEKSTSSTCTAEAMKFVPTSFVKRANHPPGALQKVDNLKLTSSLPERGGSAAIVTSSEPSAQTVWSYYSDMAITVVIGGFAFCWIKSILANDKGELGVGFPFFEKSVLDSGFCNKVFENPGTRGPLTKKNCFYADCAMVIGSYFLAKSKNKERTPLFLLGAIYTIIHGSVHYNVFSDPSSSTGPLDPLSTIILSFILIFCPLGLYEVLEVAPQVSKDASLPLSVVTWLGCVAVYYFIFRKKDYVLPYINLSALLPMYAAKTLLLGLRDEEQIAERDNFDAKFFKNFRLGQIATWFLIFIMCSEPFSCGTWFGDAGGHLLFDVALYIYLMVRALAE